MLKERTVWKYFFHLMVFFFIIELLIFPPRNLLEIGFIFLVLISLLALYGYSYQKRLSQQIYWKVNFIVQIIILLATLLKGFMDFLHWEFTLPDIIGFVMFILLAGPVIACWYYVQFSYAYKSDELWNARKVHWQ